MSAFARYVGIDYSGARTSSDSLKGLRVYLADRASLPEEVLPPPSPRRYWTRRGIAEWLVARLSEDLPTLVGIDHGFSFPLRYFEVHLPCAHARPVADEAPLFKTFRPVNGCANPAESGDAKKSGHGFCRAGAGSRAGAARRSEPLTPRRGDTLNHGCKRNIFALTAMLISFFVANFCRFCATGNRFRQLLDHRVRQRRRPIQLQLQQCPLHLPHSLSCVVRSFRAK